MLSAVAARKAALAKSAAEAQSGQGDRSEVAANSNGSSVKTAATQERVVQHSQSENSEPELSTFPVSDNSAGNGRRKRKRSRKARYFSLSRDEEQPLESLPLHLQERDVEMLPVGVPLPGDFNSIKITRNERAWSPSNPEPLSSSSSESESEELLPPSRPLTGVPIPLPRLTTWVPSPSNCFELPSTASLLSKLLLLRPSEAISLIGTYTLTIFRGRVLYQGTILSTRDKTLPIFAPKCSPVGRLEALETEDFRPSSLETLPSHLQQLVLAHNGVAIAISELITGVEVVGRVFPAFKDIFVAPGQDPLKLRTATIVQGDHAYPHFIPSSWQEAIDFIAEPAADSSVLQTPVFLSRGPKGSGKSSFSQLLINSLLRKYAHVALLDTDPGQSMVSPPSLVSLHIFSAPFFGPSFANPRIPARSHFLGSVNIRTCTERWLECVEDLVRTWRLDWSFSSSLDNIINSDKSEDDTRIDGVVPLVINTPGWTKGYGSILLRQLTELADPSHMFIFPELPNNDPFAVIQEPDLGIPPDSRSAIFHLDPIPPSPLTARYSAADFRTASLLSYLHAQLPPNRLNGLGVQCTRWEATKSFISMEPWSVSYKSGGAIDRVYLCGPWAGDVVSSEIARVLDCAIVGLVDGGQTAHPEGDNQGIPYIRNDQLPSPESSTCLGLGLIRAVDEASSCFHLLTPLPPSVLARCRVLMKGEIELPVWGFLNFGEDPGDGAPYLDWGSAKGVAGGEKRRVRRNVMRKGQM